MRAFVRCIESFLGETTVESLSCVALPHPVPLLLSTLHVWGPAPAPFLFRGLPPPRPLHLMLQRGALLLSSAISAKRKQSGASRDYCICTILHVQAHPEHSLLAAGCQEAHRQRCLKGVGVISGGRELSIPRSPGAARLGLQCCCYVGQEGRSAALKSSLVGSVCEVTKRAVSRILHEELPA